MEASSARVRPDNDTIDRALTLFGKQYLQFRHLAQRVREMAEDIAQEHLIRASVQHRVKSEDRLRKKLYAWREKGKLDDLLSADAILERVGDISAVRITTYLERDRERFADKLGERLEVIQTERKDAAGSLYRALHLDVSLPEEDLRSQEDRAVRGMRCEIQVCTLLSHVYSEIEHDLRYKPLSGQISEDEERLLNALGHLALTGDQIILSLIERSEQRVREEAHGKVGASRAEADTLDVMVALAPKLGFLRNHRDNADSVVKLLHEAGIQTVDDIESTLLDDGAGAEWARLAGLIGEKLTQRAGANPLGGKLAPFDPASADGLLLLAANRQRERLNELLANRGPGRPSRGVQIVRELLELL